VLDFPAPHSKAHNESIFKSRTYKYHCASLNSLAQRKLISELKNLARVADKNKFKR
jgi:hypothetical protein